MGKHLTVLVAGATGSIGRLVVAEALHSGYAVRALTRNAERARRLPKEAGVFIGDVTKPDTLVDAMTGVDAIVLALGSEGGGKAGAEAVDYGGVRNLLRTAGNATSRIVLMTAIGVTHRTGAYNRSTEAHDWKRRAERLVRASGLAYTIVRPGWFDANQRDQHHLDLLQGDTRHAGDPSDGVIARAQIAQVLVASLSSDAARSKTFELVAVKGSAQADLDPLFAALDADPPTTLDAVRDSDNMPLANEPQRVRDDLAAVVKGRISLDSAPRGSAEDA